MTPELDQHIREKYPKIFQYPCEMSIGDGWFDIIDCLLSNIQGHIDHSITRQQWAIDWNKQVNNADYDWSDKSSFVKREEREVPDIVEQVVASQIKEKFGTLRFYFDGGDEYCDALVAMAESMSGRLCEECGKPGNSNGTGWIKTLCEEHRQEQEIRNEQLRNRVNENLRNRIV